MLPRVGCPALPLPPPPLLPLLLLLLGASGGGGGRAHAEVLFRCPPCTPERLAACGPPPVAPPAAVAAVAGGARMPCAELVREPGCGCCSVCARLEGEACGVYTRAAARGCAAIPTRAPSCPCRRWLWARALVRSAGTPSMAPARSRLQTMAMTTRKPLKSGMKELAVFREKVAEQHRQMGKGGKHHLGLEEPKKLRPPPARTPCQQELDQVLERISTMRLPDERGPLEHLYSLHIPNCDKHGLYNLKQCKMSLNGQRGECWCVNPNTGKLIQGAPTIRGDPECHLFYNEQQEARGVHTQRMQ
uniref:Insulin-like growth factor-binding protein 2 n=1 Tax=Macaca fascicularis TaxID=9541 RepID=A0A7N9CSG0_MACFA